MATTKHIAYSAKVSLYFDYNGNRDVIMPQKISYIMIDHQYDDNVLPIIYVSLLANNDLYKKINKYKDIGKFSLTIKKYAKNSKTPIEKTLISDSFNYIPSTIGANYKEELNQYAPNDDSYKSVLVGLMSSEMTEKLRTPFNGTYKNISQSSLIGLALEGTNPVVQALTTNKSYSNFIIPPLNSRYRLIEYVFNKNPFYNTLFRFYMDFDRTYLLSKEGKKVSAGDGKPESILITVGSMQSANTFQNGFDISDDHYSINILPSDIKYIVNDVTQNKVSKITVIDKDNKISNLEIDNDYSGSKNALTDSKEIFVRSNNPDIIKNELELGQITLELSKLYLDPSIFTINKIINVVNYGENSKYDGQYILISKKEIYKPNADDFTIATGLVLKRLGRLNQSHESKSTKNQQYSKEINKAVKNTSKKTSTASLKKEANSRFKN